MALDANAQNFIAQVVRQATGSLRNNIIQLQAELNAIKGVKSGVYDPYPDIPGRRVSYNLVGTQDFTTAQDGQTGSTINMLVSVDGPFIMTHFPLVVWKPTTPTNATNFGIWRTISSADLPTQQVTTDYIDISWQLIDTGPTRNLQNDVVPGGVLSNPRELKKLPTPTKFEPNTTITFTPTYENISFNASGTATTGGRLCVVLPGIKILTTLGNGS